MAKRKKKVNALNIQCVGCTPWVWIVLLILGLVFLLKDYMVVTFKATGWSIILLVLALMGLLGAFSRKK